MPGPNREIHRALSLTDPPYMQGPDVEEFQQAIVEDFKLLKLPIVGPKDDGAFGPRTNHKANRVLYFLGSDPVKDKPAGPLFTQHEQKLIRDPSARNIKQKDRSKRRVDKYLANHHDHGGFEGIRKQIVAYANWGCANEPQIHYGQVRPYPTNPRALPMLTDCSGFATLAYKDAGGPDPNGLGFSGYGFTGTILSHCQHIPASECKPGDLIVYGPGSGHHVVIAIEAGANPMTVSHGQEAGPFKISHGDEDNYQPEPDTFCRALDD